MTDTAEPQADAKIDSSADQARQPWHLRGNYAPIDDELSVADLDVTGALPPTLSGRYFRNGPNPRDGSGHWFFGDGMIHGIRLTGGRAEWYRNRYVRTPKFERNLDSFDPDSLFDPTASAANTHVLAHAGRIWALEEGHLPWEVSPDLDTVGCDDFGGRLTTAFTAHPKLCPETGELHFFGYSPLPPFLTYHVLDATGALVHSAPISVPQGTMMHDFMITRDHAIFMDLPVVFDLDGPSGVPIRWDDQYQARVGIVPRRGTDADVTWFDVDPCYVFHPFNAFVDPANSNRVVCDVGRHAHMWRDSMNDFPPSYLHRWTFDLATGSVTEEHLDDVQHAFPRVDERMVGLPHRYGWAAGPRTGVGGDGADPGVLIKYDLADGMSSTTHDFGPDAYPGEFVFVPDDATSGEDEGWAVGLVYDQATDRSDLYVLDATDMSAAPQAIVHLPRRVPFGFHGSWIDDADLGEVGGDDSADSHGRSR